MQFGFKERVGCTEASYTILESINHMLERGNKVFGCFLTFARLSIQYGLTVSCLNFFLNSASEDACGELLEASTPALKLRYFTQVHCPENLTFYRVLGRVKFLLHSCTKSTLMNY